MKNKLIILSILFAFIWSGCEKVVDVKLDTEQPRLVVDASLTWLKGTNGKNQTIKLTTTTGYYNQEIPKVSNATVYITNSSNMRFDFLEKPNTGGHSGKYSCSNFIPVIGETYTLTIIYKGETYKAQEKLSAVNSIENVEQRADLGLNRDEYGIKVNFQDAASQNNFYLFTYSTSYTAFPSIDVFDDQLLQGNKAFGVYSLDKLKKDDTIEITLRETSQRHFNYMKKLISTANGGSGGPFQPSPASTIRGNLVNQTNESNYCLGYFSISETDKITYTIK
ncbi:MAG TPA: DUF4249 domain-containing protein [Daejeonella sp.]|uniref:DUF4249 domain-containing protein n=1 Tax=Daejeonella sp. TaxID=2805397 RepID=UPI002ED999E0